MARKVLVVDDSLVIRQMVSVALTKAGYEAQQAVDGLDALEKVKAISGIALIVCDVNMPRMSGVELVEELQRQGSQIPIIMLTTEGQPELIQRAKSAGVKGWLVKPFKAEMLLLAINKLTGEPAQKSATP